VTAIRFLADCKQLLKRDVAAAAGNSRRHTACLNRATVALPSAGCVATVCR
jgi:hypothetical protein